MRNAAFESAKPMSRRKDKQLTSVFKEIKMFPSQEKVNIWSGHLDIVCEYFDFTLLYKSEET